MAEQHGDHINIPRQDPPLARVLPFGNPSGLDQGEYLALVDSNQPNSERINKFDAIATRVITGLFKAAVRVDHALHPVAKNSATINEQRSK